MCQEPYANHMKNIKQLIRSNEQGLTLIETMIAMVLLGIVGLAIISGIGTAFRANAIADGQETAMTIAQRQFEIIEYQDYIPVTAGNQVNYSILDLTTETNFAGYSIWSYQYNAAYDPDDGDQITDLVMSATSAGPIGIPWDSEYGDGTPASENGLQRIKLAIVKGTDPDITKNKILLTLATYKHNPE